MTAQTARKPASSTARQTARRPQPQPKVQLKPVPAPQPQASKPAAKPTATIDLGERKVSYWFPVATLASGEQLSCSHSKYGHESEASARRCVSALVAKAGHVAA